MSSDAQPPISPPCVAQWSRGDLSYDETEEGMLLAARRGDANCQFMIGMSALYHKFASDEALGVDMLSRAADQGHKEATLKLAIYLFELDDDTEDVRRGYANAFELFERVRHLGLSEALLYLGDASASGRGVEQNVVQAVAHYKAGVKAGVELCERRLLALRERFCDRAEPWARWCPELHCLVNDTLHREVMILFLLMKRMRIPRGVSLRIAEFLASCPR